MGFVFSFDEGDGDLGDWFLGLFGLDFLWSFCLESEILGEGFLAAIFNLDDNN